MKLVKLVVLKELGLGPRARLARPPPPPRRRPGPPPPAPRPGRGLSSSASKKPLVDEAAPHPAVWRIGGHGGCSPAATAWRGSCCRVDGVESALLHHTPPGPWACAAEPGSLTRSRSPPPCPGGLRSALPPPTSSARRRPQETVGASPLRAPAGRPMETPVARCASHWREPTRPLSPGHVHHRRGARWGGLLRSGALGPGAPRAVWRLRDPGVSAGGMRRPCTSQAAGLWLRIQEVRSGC